jgi:hypothetical protein
LIALSQEELKRLLDYDPKTGIFIWKIWVNHNARAGYEAGSLDNKGYISISIKGIRYGGHQLAWLYVYGYIPHMVDHKDGIRKHNAIDNLQESSYEQNNRKKCVYNPLGYKGVRYRSGAFQAHIRINGVITRIGTYKTAEEAGEAYVAKAKELNGEFENRED